MGGFGGSGGGTVIAPVYQEDYFDSPDFDIETVEWDDSDEWDY